MPSSALAVRCPHCGNPSGLCLAPREVRTGETPIRCFACRGDAPMYEWFKDGTAPFTHDGPRPAP